MKRVLIAPLDWGLGHATRCIPVIRKLQQRGCEVMLAGSGESLQLLRAEFPLLKSFSIEGYNPVYPSDGQMAAKMIQQIPKFFRAISIEHRQIEALVSEQKIDLIISDNRYGCWSSVVPSVFITHQSNIMIPQRFGWLRGIVRKLNENYIKRFTFCWVPDFKEKLNLAGDLISFGKSMRDVPIFYVGPLSRFRPSHASPKNKYDILAVFSGPEPQRTILENMVMPQLKASGIKYFVVRGILHSTETHESNVVNFLTATDLQEKIESSDIVLARSGYSTVMDMAALGKKVIFIPTPEQTEQEYLARRLKEMNIAFSIPQKKFNLANALKEAKTYSGFSVIQHDDEALEMAIDSALRQESALHEKVS